jgi:hypothetical protein
MSCVLRISGKKFDVISFLKDTNLKPYKIFKKGELIGPTAKSKNRYIDNGCYFDVSKAEFNNVDKQISDSIRFLKKNFSHFEALSQYGLRPKDKPVLDFGIESRLKKNTVVQCDRLPPELLLLCGQLGFAIELSQYWVIKGQNCAIKHMLTASYRKAND